MTRPPVTFWNRQPASQPLAVRIGPLPSLCPADWGNSRRGAPFLNIIKAGLRDHVWIRETKKWAALSGMSGGSYVVYQSHLLAGPAKSTLLFLLPTFAGTIFIAAERQA